MTAKQLAVCESKVAYLSERTAKNAGWLWHLVYGTRFDVYHCPVCRDYHLTTRREAL